MTQQAYRPAWSEQFTPEALRDLDTFGPLAQITPEWAWDGSTGRGVRVAVVDTGVEADHPALGDSVKGGFAVELDEESLSGYQVLPEDPPRDLAGHGTACAGIIHALAPEAEIYSVRVLGRNARGRVNIFAGGLEWAIKNDMHVINLSLSTSNQAYFALFHSLADEAVFKGVALVSAVNNVPAPSYPSTFASVFSVAAHETTDPFTFYYNPNPPVEFGASGIDVPVAWLNKQYAVNTGNSFAAPHIAGIITLIRAKHPELTPVQIKTVLMACAANVRRHNHEAPAE